MTPMTLMAPRRTRHASVVGVCAWLILLPACSPFETRHHNESKPQMQIWSAEESPLKIQAAQTRWFDTTDRRNMLRAVVMTLQDLHGIVEALDEELGIVSAKAYVDRVEPTTDHKDFVQLTVTVRTRNASQLLVRANAQFNRHPVEDPAVYQQFFRALEQAVFLGSHTVKK
jgi:hypothetical protein